MIEKEPKKKNASRHFVFTLNTGNFYKGYGHSHEGKPSHALFPQHFPQFPLLRTSACMSILLKLKSKVVQSPLVRLGD